MLELPTSGCGFFRLLDVAILVSRNYHQRGIRRDYGSELVWHIDFDV